MSADEQAIAPKMMRATATITYEAKSLDDAIRMADNWLIEPGLTVVGQVSGDAAGFVNDDGDLEEGAPPL